MKNFQLLSRSEMKNIGGGYESGGKCATGADCYVYNSETNTNYHGQCGTESNGQCECVTDLGAYTPNGGTSACWTNNN